MNKTWLQTFTGQDVSPFLVDPDKVNIRDIAHALSLKARFTGHTKAPYSVSEHCVRGSNLISTGYRLAFLLHELSEVYLPDIPAPIKAHVFLKTADGMETWENLERRHTSAMLHGLKLRFLEPLVHSATVKHMDLSMLAWEKRDLMGPEPRSWDLTVPPPDGVGTLRPWDWDKAENEFLVTFEKLASVFDDSEIPTGAPL